MLESYIMRQKPQENLRKYELNLNLLSFIKQSLYKNSTLSFITFSALNVRGKVKSKFVLATNPAIIGIKQEREHQTLALAE